MELPRRLAGNNYLPAGAYQALLINSGREILEESPGGKGLNHLVLGTQAPGTQVKALFLAVNSDGGWVDIGGPAPVGPALGMAYIMSEKRRFAT